MLARWACRSNSHEAAVEAHPSRAMRSMFGVHSHAAVTNSSRRRVIVGHDEDDIGPGRGALSAMGATRISRVQCPDEKAF